MVHFRPIAAPANAVTAIQIGREIMRQIGLWRVAPFVFGLSCGWHGVFAPGPASASIASIEAGTDSGLILANSRSSSSSSSNQQQQQEQAQAERARARAQAVRDRNQLARAREVEAGQLAQNEEEVRELAEELKAAEDVDEKASLRDDISALNEEMKAQRNLIQTMDDQLAQFEQNIADIDAQAEETEYTDASTLSSDRDGTQSSDESDSDIDTDAAEALRDDFEVVIDVLAEELGDAQAVLAAAEQRRDDASDDNSVDDTNAVIEFAELQIEMVEADLAAAAYGREVAEQAAEGNEETLNDQRLTREVANTLRRASTEFTTLIPDADLPATEDTPERTTEQTNEQGADQTTAETTPATTNAPASSSSSTATTTETAPAATSSTSTQVASTMEQDALVGYDFDIPAPQRYLARSEARGPLDQDAAVAARTRAADAERRRQMEAAFIKVGNRTDAATTELAAAEEDRERILFGVNAFLDLRKNEGKPVTEAERGQIKTDLDAAERRIVEAKAQLEHLDMLFSGLIAGLLPRETIALREGRPLPNDADDDDDS